MDICRQVVGTEDKHLGNLFACLVGIVRVLRSDRGCPWDRKQTLEDTKEFLLEEVYELVSALSKEDWKEVEEEVGDLLLLAVFVSQIGRERRLFSLKNALQEVVEKLVRRHPHVFGDLSLEDAEQVIENWTRIKDQEKRSKGKSGGVWDSVPICAPALFQYYTYLKEKKKRKEAVVVDEESVKSKLIELLSSPNLSEEDLANALFRLVEICYIKGVDPELLLLQRIMSLRSEGGD